MKKIKNVFFLSSVLLHRIKLWKCPTCFKECFNLTKSREDKSRFGIVYSNSSVCEEYKLFIRGSLLHKKQNHRHSNVINESSRINSTLILSLHTTNTNLNIWFIIKRLQQSSTLKGRGGGIMAPRLSRLIVMGRDWFFQGTNIL